MKVNEILSDDFLASLATNESITPDTVGFWDDVGIEFISEFGNLAPSLKLEYLANNYTGATLTDRVIRLIFNKFGFKWSRTLETLDAEYNPIYNTEWRETQTNSGTDSITLTRDMTRTDNLSDRTTYGKTDTTTHGETVTFTAGVEHVTETEHGETVTKTIDTLESNTHSISADNAATLTTTSSDSRDYDGSERDAHSGSDTVTETSSGVDTTAHGGATSSTATGSDTVTHGGTVSDEGTDVTETEHGHVITTERAGNIGVTTSAELVADEIKMRALHIYFDIVVNDIRSVLCSYIWG